MTYGWAILVIAVVLGVLYSLGVFSPSNFAPKAQPGSCQVFRPNGPGTSYDINLEGTCNGELPQYVAQFDGQSYVQMGFNITSSLITSSTGVTESAWIYILSLPNGDPTVFSINDAQLGLGKVTSTTAQVRPCVGSACPLSVNTIPTNQWEQISYTYNGTTGIIYINGINQGTFSAGSLSTNGVACISQVSLHTACNGGWPFDGYISNIQAYNTSFSANEISMLYNEGIGGAPIKPQNLIGWWPLNGDVNDYSGNNNNGVPTKVLFIGTWQSGYTPP